MYHSLLALAGVEIATVILVLAMCVALVAIIAILLLFYKKHCNIERRLAEQQSPIVIHQTKKVAATKQIVYVPASEPELVAEPVEEVQEPEEVVAEEIAVAEAPASVVVDESENVMRYNRSFRARLIQSSDEVKEWYGTLKNAILAYKRVSSRISWKQESFSYRRNPVAKLFLKGKTLYLYLPLNASDYADTKYKLEDVSKISQFAETPALYKLKSERRIKYAQDLIDEVCTKLGSTKTEREPVDYYEPYNSDVALIKKGLVKRVIEDASKSFIGASGFSKAQDNDMEFDDKN